MNPDLIALITSITLAFTGMALEVARFLLRTDTSSALQRAARLNTTAIVLFFAAAAAGVFAGDTYGYGNPVIWFIFACGDVGTGRDLRAKARSARKRERAKARAELAQRWDAINRLAEDLEMTTVSVDLDLDLHREH